MTKGYKIGDEVVSKSTGQTYKISNKKNGGYFLETADGYILATKYQNLKKYFDKVTQNVANLNSEDLTELYHKGKLPKGYYYLKKPDGEVMIITPSLRFMVDGYSILAEVPSYEEWFNQGDYVAFLEEENKALKEELQNQAFILKSRESEIEKLKELLKQAKKILKNEGFYIISQEIDQVLGEE